MTRADIVNAVKDIRAAPTLSIAVDLALAHLVHPVAAGTEQTAPAEPPDELGDGLHTGDDELLDALIAIRVGIEDALEGEHGTMSADLHEALGDIFEDVNRADEIRVAQLKEAAAPAEPPANDGEDELFKDWTLKFTVWLVRDGESWPMLIDTVWLNEADAQKRAELRGGKWHATKYSHLQPPREAADGRSSTPTPQPRSGDTR